MTFFGVDGVGVGVGVGDGDGVGVGVGVGVGNKLEITVAEADKIVIVTNVPGEMTAGSISDFTLTNLSTGESAYGEPEDVPIGLAEPARFESTPRPVSAGTWKVDAGWYVFPAWVEVRFESTVPMVIRVVYPWWRCVFLFVLYALVAAVVWFVGHMIMFV